MPNVEAKPNADLLADSPQMLTTGEVASLLRVDTATVIRWTTQQRLVSIKVGPRLHRFPKDAVEKYLREAALSSTSN